MVNNIKNNTISEIDAKKRFNTLNKIKNAEIIHKRLIPGQKELLNLFNDLLDIILTDKTLKSESQEDKNKNEKVESKKEEYENENEKVESQEDKNKNENQKLESKQEENKNENQKVESKKEENKNENEKAESKKEENKMKMKN